MDTQIQVNYVYSMFSLINMETDDFLALLEEVGEKPMILMAQNKGLLQQGYQYMVHFKGFNFTTKSPEKVPMPASALMIESKKGWATHIY